MAFSLGLTADGGCGGGGRCLKGWLRPLSGFWVNSSLGTFALSGLSGIKGQFPPPLRLFILFHIKCDALLPGGSAPLMSWKACSSYSSCRFSFSLLERAIMAGLIVSGSRGPKPFADLFLNMERWGEVTGGPSGDAPKDSVC